MKFYEEKSRWVTPLPWIRSPTELQNNYKVAFAILRSTEKKLLANTNHKEVYGKQIEDMLDRGAARRVTQKELANYKGPVFYLSHHAVMKPDSKSTPCRIVSWDYR